ETIDPIALQISKLAREGEVDAVYLFTNGFVGGNSYRSFTMNLEHLGRAVEGAGVRLYVRMPFETGPPPVRLQRLALASQGQVFQGRREDEDWKLNQLEAK
ncbi:MAG: hypothetical protein AAGC68_01120, partial [Verrucomicrobiota bacterium]